MKDSIEKKREDLRKFTYDFHLFLESVNYYQPWKSRVKGQIDAAETIFKSIIDDIEDDLYRDGN